MFQPKMIKDYEATDARVELEDGGKTAVLSFLTHGEDRVYISIQHSVLEHLLRQSAAALSAEPMPSRFPSRGEGADDRQM